MRESHTVLTTATATVLRAPRDPHRVRCVVQLETEDARRPEAAIVTYPDVLLPVADHAATIDSDVESDPETQNRGAAENAAEADPEVQFVAIHPHLAEVP